MANGKIDLKTAKGAIAGAAAGALGERNYKAEEALRDSIRAAKTAGATVSDIEKIVGSAVMNTIDRYGCDEMPLSAPKVEAPPRGLARTLSKIASARQGGAVKSQRHFIAGFAAGIAGELRKEAATA